MTWISINPDSEPQSSVKMAAFLVNATPEEITSTQMADAYNQVEASVEQQDDADIGGFIGSISALFDEDIEEEGEEVEQP